MDCSRMSEKVLLAIIFLAISLADAYHMTDVSFQPTKLFKTKNINIVLRCLLLDKHERFNQNSSVTWWFRKTCKGSCWNSSGDEDAWTEYSCQGSCGLTLELDDKTASNGYYLCKIFPYLSEQGSLQVEITKTFEVAIVDPSIAPPPELLDDTPNKFLLPVNSQLLLQCKCKSAQKPTIKWFRKKEDSYSGNDELESFIESSRSIKYFENFYAPLVSSGLKELSDHSGVYLTINYYGFSYRESFVSVQPTSFVGVQVDEADDLDEESIDLQKEKNYSIVIIVPIVLLMPSSVLLCTLFYLLVNRQIMRSNKSIEIV